MPIPFGHLQMYKPILMSCKDDFPVTCRHPLSPLFISHRMHQLPRILVRWLTLLVFSILNNEVNILDAACELRSYMLDTSGCIAVRELVENLSEVVRLPGALLEGVIEVSSVPSMKRYIRDSVERRRVEL